MSLEYVDSGHFVESVINRIEKKDFAGAGGILRDSRYKQILRCSSWDLIPFLCKKLNDKDSYAGVKEVLEFLAESVDPDEAILEFLEQMEEANEIQFSVLLLLLKTLLIKDVAHKKNCLEWCLNSVRLYLERISAADDLSTKNLENSLKSILLFLEESVARVEMCDPEAKIFIKLLASRLIQLCDVLLLLGKSSNLNDIQRRVRNGILKLIPDPYVLLKHIFYRSIKVKNLEKEAPCRKKFEDLRKITDEDLEELAPSVSPFKDESAISNLSYAVFFYILESQADFQIPLVYNIKYVFLCLSYVAVSFFEKPVDATVEKGLVFLELILNRLNEQLEKCDLFFETHQKLLVALNRTMIFSEAEENRTLALKCFRGYIFSFDWEARYWLLFNLRTHVRHSGTLGYLVTILKEFVLQFLNLSVSSKTWKKFSKYYTGKLLFDLIKKYCYLSEGTSTDLVEYADHVISSLNFIRFLIIKDKTNLTDVKCFIKKIEEDFLKPLKDYISASRNHYQVRLRDLEKTDSGFSEVVQVSIKNEMLPKLTKEEEKTTCLSSLNAIDLIDSLFNRVSELVYESYFYRI